MDPVQLAEIALLEYGPRFTLQTLAEAAPASGARPGQSLGESFLRFLTALAKEGSASPNTIRHYGHDLELFARYLRKHEPGIGYVSQLTPASVEGFFNHMAGVRGNRRSSNRRRLAALRRYFRFLVSTGSIERDPSAGISLEPAPADRPEILTFDEALRLLEAAKMSRFPRRDHAIFRLFLTAGCTLSELLQLEPDDYNPESGQITFRGRKGVARTLILSPTCERALIDYLNHRPKAPADRRLFLNRHGRGITKGAVYHGFRLALKRAGINREGLTIHSLRHTCLALLWRAGVSLHIVQQVAGHRSIATTREYEWAGPRPSRPRAWHWRHPLEEEE